MKIKDTIAILAANVMFACDKAQFSEACKASVEDALTMAISALEKQEAKKIKEIHVDEYYCPVCGAENNCDDGNVNDNYCPNCGQKIYQKINYLEE